MKMTTSGNKQQKLKAIQAKWKDCMACSLFLERKNIVYLRGSIEAPLVFIGEAPGADEDLQGKPFVGRAGKLLDSLLNKAGLTKEEDFAIMNCVACRPPNNRNPFRKEFDACSPRLHSMLEIMQPKVAILLGRVPYTFLVENNHESNKGITEARGVLTEASVYSKRKGNLIKIKAIPTFHPAFLLRNQKQELKDLVVKDIQKAMRLL